MIDLLRGRFDDGVMQRLVDPMHGLFPRPKEIKMQCSCPDVARLCKHLAAVLYGVGARLATWPELLFTLRNVDHLELVNAAVGEANLGRALDAGAGDSLAGDDLGEIFGIDFDEGKTAPKRARRAMRPVAVESSSPAAATASSVAVPTTRRRAATKAKSSAAKAKPRAAKARSKTAKAIGAAGSKRARAAVAGNISRRKGR